MIGLYYIRCPTNKTLNRRGLEIIDCLVREDNKKMFNEKNKTVNQFDYTPKNDEEYLNLGDFFNEYLEENEETITTVRGFFFFDSDYGKSGAIITDNCYVYIPKHQVPIFESIAENPKEVQAVKDGKMGFTIRPYKKKLKKTTKQCYSMEFCDI